MNELWAIVVALPHEAQAILPQLSTRARVRGHGFKIWEGELGPRKVLLVQSGMGVVSAEKAAAFLVKHFPLTHLIATGYCGGLKEGVKTADAVLADALKFEDGETLALTDEAGLLDAAEQSLTSCSLRSHRGLLTTKREAVLTTEDKRALARITGAIAVDMETYPIFRALQSLPRKIPFLSLRFVLDTIDDPLTPTDGFIDTEGQVKPLRLAGEVLKRPPLVLELQGLGHKATLARTALSRWIGCFFKKFSDKIRYPSVKT